MAGNHHHHHNHNHNQQEDRGGSLGDDFFEQILAMPPGYGGAEAVGPTTTNTTTMNNSMLQLGLDGGGGGMGLSGLMPLGLNLEHRFMLPEDGGGNSSSSSTTTSGINERDSASQHVTAHFPVFGHLQPPPPPPPSQLHHHHHHHQAFYSQPTQGPIAATPQPPSFRPRVRARRGQATDPHSIAERLRRERIAERMRALQELVPSCNKTDRAAMLDEIVDYVKFLRLQVKVLSMSRLGATGAVAQLVGDLPLSSVEGGEGDHEPAWEKWSNDGTEQQVAKLMEEDIGAAMQFIQSKALCIMPISLASTIFQTHQLPDPSLIVKPESSTPP